MEINLHSISPLTLIANYIYSVILSQRVDKTRPAGMVFVCHDNL